MSKNFITILTIFFFLSVSFTFSQKISVKSFELLANDLEARMNPVIFDGDICALLKIETPTKNLVFEGGSLGIAKVVQKKGEVWVYVPYGARFLTIKHEQLGVLRNYEYPTGKLQKATTYAMQLTTAKITTIVEEKLPQFGLIKSNPDGADVYIDGIRRGKTPTNSLSLLEGVHAIKITKHLYEDLETTLNVTAENKFSENYILNPKFGDIEVDSKPESGASITIDGVLQKETTPATISFLEEGNHTISIDKDMFDISESTFSIRKQETKALTLTMQPLYGELSITTKPQAYVYIDNQVKSTGSWSGRVLKGVHLISVKKAKYNTENITHTAIIGKKQAYDFELKPKLGTLELTSVPLGATVFIDGERKGETPIYIRNLLIGEHIIKLEKINYTNQNKSVVIKENEITKNNIILKKKIKKQKKYTDTKSFNLYSEKSNSIRKYREEKIRYSLILGQEKSGNSEIYNFYGGIQMEGLPYRLNKKWGALLDLLYSGNGIITVDDNTWDSEIESKTIYFSFNFYRKIRKHMKIFGGFYVNSTSLSNYDPYMDLGISLGAKIDIGYRFYLQAKYMSPGIEYKDDNTMFYPENTIQLGIGINLN